MFRFSLRTLMVVMLLAGPLLAAFLWVGREVNWAAAIFLLMAATLGGGVGARASRRFLSEN
jgi:hypothetical protein